MDPVLPKQAKVITATRAEMGGAWRARLWACLHNPKVSFALLIWALVSTTLHVWFEQRAELASLQKGCPHKFAGGWPSQDRPGSCWCGGDAYCMCTPSLAIDAIIEVPGPVDGQGKKTMPSIVLVRRRDPPLKYALPGGFVNVGETVEGAATREVKEETNLEVDSLEQFHLYSDPTRDERRHTASAVFRCLVSSVAQLKAKDDARSAKAWRLDELLALELAFDHRQILIDYVNRYHKDLAPFPAGFDGGKVRVVSGGGRQ